MIDVLVPVLRRPERAEPLVRSLAAATSVEWTLLFLASPGDDDEIRECRRLVEPGRVDVVTCPFERADGDYARKINHGFAITENPWVFQAADDLRFEDEWDVRALAYAIDSVQVIGTNDLGNPSVKRGLLSTHSLIRREYVESRGASLDGPGVVLHEGYRHNFVDEELVALARSRRVFVSARDSVVEHLHPLWSKGPSDPIYDLGLEGYRDDSRLFRERQRQIIGRRRGRA